MVSEFLAKRFWWLSFTEVVCSQGEAWLCDREVAFRGIELMQSLNRRKKRSGRPDAFFLELVNSAKGKQSLAHEASVHQLCLNYNASRGRKKNRAKEKPRPTVLFALFAACWRFRLRAQCSRTRINFACSISKSGEIERRAFQFGREMALRRTRNREWLYFKPRNKSRNALHILDQRTYTMRIHTVRSRDGWIK